MFTQLRHAVESIAQTPKTTGSPESGASGSEAPARSSLDSLGIRTSLSSSSQLAETALSSLRKTLVTQRPASPANNAQVASSPPESAATPAPKPRPATRTTLEDRLRAKFAIGDASNASTPATSSRASPAAVAVADHPLAGPSSRSSTPDIPVVKGPPNPLSPASTPLPDSPLVSPSLEPPLSLAASAASISAASPPEPLETQSRPDPIPSVPLPADPEPDTPKLLDPRARESEPVAESAQGDSKTSSHPEEPSDTVTTSVPEEEAALASAPPEEAAAIPVELELNPEASDAAEVAERPPSSDAPREPVPSTQNTPEELQSDAPKIGVLPEPVPPAGTSPEEPSAVPEVTTSDPDVPPSDAPASQVHPQTDAAVSRGSLDIPSRSATPDVKGSDKTDVEALQKRLKLVEQRFAGKLTSVLPRILRIHILVRCFYLLQASSG
ncbi:hypothetical protein OH77DRAFT_407658 [Trametes cingulata]|nr:hypothetical protein OH77DRAFT_407658 [Trametes cingulata]